MSHHLEIEEIDKVTIVHFMDTKVTDPNTIELIGEQLFRLVDDLGKAFLLLNFRKVEFMSSATVGKLMSLHTKVQAIPGKVVLCGISSKIQELFDIMSLEQLIEIYPNEQAALQAF